MPTIEQCHPIYMKYQRSQIHEKKLSSQIKIGASILAILVLIILWISWA